VKWPGPHQYGIGINKAEGIECLELVHHTESSEVDLSKISRRK
jgi:hypothetical protein